MGRNIDVIVSEFIQIITGVLVQEMQKRELQGGRGSVLVNMTESTQKFQRELYEAIVAEFPSEVQKVFPPSKPTCFDFTEGGRFAIEMCCKSVAKTLGVEG